MSAWEARGEKVIEDACSEPAAPSTTGCTSRRGGKECQMHPFKLCTFSQRHRNQPQSGRLNFYFEIIYLE